jgi:hypothetical protein
MRSSVPPLRLAAVLAAALLLVTGLTTSHAAPKKGASVPSPTVTGPIPSTQGSHGRPQTDMAFDLAPYGYAEEEYFVSGTAKTYTAEPTTAEYTTRMLVRRPVDPKHFNGTVIVEWNNVTAQHDQSPDWFWSYPMALREGFAYVVVSAQKAGICCATPLTLQVIDNGRYGELSHPGDDYSFDMFSQVAKALRDPQGVDPLGGLKVQRALAAGHSQSASRLYSYVTTVHGDADVFDGFFIDGGGSQTWPAEPLDPVLHVREEGWQASPVEPNVDRNYRLWEVAGATHADYWVLRQQFDNPERLVPQQPQFGPGWREREEEIAGNYGYDLEPRQTTCPVGGGMFPKRYTVSAGLKRLDEWVRTERPAPRVPRLEFDANGQIARDEHGNGKGGLRLPPIDVPVATYVSGACQLFGVTLPLPPTTLRELYPTHDDYVSKMRAATDRAVAAGILLPEDAADLMQRAQASLIPDRRVRSPLPLHLVPEPPV